MTSGRVGSEAVIAIARELRSCSLADLPPALAARVRIQQLNSLAIYMLVMSVMGEGTAALTLYEYWDAGLHWLLLSALSLITISYVYIASTAMRWAGRSPLARGSTNRMLRRFVLGCASLGAGWAALEILLMSHSDPGQRALLYGLIIGLMSAPAMVTPCSAAFAFWSPVTVGALVSIGLVSGIRDLGGTFLVIGYTSLSLFCLLYLNRALIKRVVAEIQQTDGRATIDLLLRDFEDSAGDWLWETDAHGCLTHVSARFVQITGKPASDLIGKELTALCRADPADTVFKTERGKTKLETLIDCRLAFRELEADVRIGKKTMCWALTGKPKLDANGIFEGFRGVGSDITETKAAKDRAAFLASFDELTGLANRRRFRERLENGLAVPSTPHVAVFCLDLDGFKAVNDRHGHAMGDQLLTMFAERLRNLLRDSDICARLGGDEFAVAVFDLKQPAVLSVARRMIVDLSAPYGAYGFLLNVGVSIGVAFADTPDANAGDLLKGADTALYCAKSDGRGTWRLFDEDLRQKSDRRLKLQEELAQAIPAGGLELVFQPIAPLGSRHPVALEALVRWHRHNGEAVPPSEFITLAEDSGLILDLGRWVLRKACFEAAHLSPDLRIAINVSPLQLRDQDFIMDLRQILASTGLSPARLDIEVTETAFLDMNQVTLDLLDEIHALGVGIILDDFGVGQTSLDHLRKYPFSAIKIDQSFIREMPTSRASRAIVRGVVGMARELGIATTAEGIETVEHLDIVRTLGCDYWQGYLLGRPEKLVHSRCDTDPDMAQAEW